MYDHMTLQSRPRRVERVLAQDAGDEVILLDSRGGEYFTLDAVGAFIWQRCDGESPVERIVEDLCSSFDAQRTVVEADTLEFLAELARQRLVDDVAGA